MPLASTPLPSSAPLCGKPSCPACRRPNAARSATSTTSATPCCWSPATASPPTTTCFGRAFRARARCSTSSPISGSGSFPGCFPTTCWRPSPRISRRRSPLSPSSCAAAPCWCARPGWCPSSVWPAATWRAAPSRNTKRRAPPAASRCRTASSGPAGCPSRFSRRPPRPKSGHDENVDFATLEGAVGAELAGRLRDATLELYRRGRDHAAAQGLLLADTKFEFGQLDGELLLIDEVLTPDSSRYWDAADWRPGVEPVSFDKQFVRNWLDCERLGPRKQTSGVARRGGARYPRPLRGGLPPPDRPGSRLVTGEPAGRQECIQLLVWNAGASRVNVRARRLATPGGHHADDPGSFPA